MSDRDLLRFAAKAAGIEFEWKSRPVFFGPRDMYGVRERNFVDVAMLASGRIWNPLEDDGDALRLAVVMGRSDRLCVSIHIDEPFDGDAGPYTYVDARRFGEHNAYHGDDPFAATRRAIVEAAAEIVRRS